MINSMNSFQSMCCVYSLYIKPIYDIQTQTDLEGRTAKSAKAPPHPIVRFWGLICMLLVFGELQQGILKVLIYSGQPAFVPRSPF